MSLSRVATDQAPALLLDIEDAAATLLASCLAQGNPGVIDDAVLSPVLRLSILKFIDANLADPKTGAAAIDAAVPEVAGNISTGCLPPRGRDACHQGAAARCGISGAN